VTSHGTKYDDDQLGALTYHDEHIAAASPDVTERHQVVIGPWDHAGTRSGARAFGGLTFAEASQIDLLALMTTGITGFWERPAGRGSCTTV
jgi:hypothetical protein